MLSCCNIGQIADQNDFHNQTTRMEELLNVLGAYTPQLQVRR
jgi:hypothetical protein